MSQDKALQLFITYQSLHVKYKEIANRYRREFRCQTRVYSDSIAALALRKANEYEGIYNALNN